jgi:hypothetical protein
MRLVTKVMAGLVLATALLLASGDSGLAQYNCGFLTIEQCRANLTAREFILRAQSILQSARACQTHP